MRDVLLDFGTTVQGNPALNLPDLIFDFGERDLCRYGWHRIPAGCHTRYPGRGLFWHVLAVQCCWFHDPEQRGLARFRNYIVLGSCNGIRSEKVPRVHIRLDLTPTERQRGRVLYLGSFLDEAIVAERGLRSHNAAGSNRMARLARALRSAGFRPILLSPATIARARRKGGALLHPARIRRSGGVVIIHAPAT